MEPNYTELTKEELLEAVNKMTTKVKGVEEKIQKLEEFYKANLIDDGDSLCNQTKFINAKGELEGYRTETLIDADGKPSTKTVINNLISEIQTKQKEISDAQKLLLEDGEGKESIKTQIIKIKDDFSKVLKDVEQFKTEILIDREGKPSTKTIISDLILNSQNTNTEIQKKHDEISAAQKLLLLDEEGRESVKTQIIKIKDDFSKNITESDKDVKELRKFHKQVFEKTIDEERGTEQEGLKATVESLSNRLNKLTTEAEKRLFGLTDSSLQHAFASRANEYTTEFKDLEEFTFKLTLALVADIAIFGVIELLLIIFDKGFNYHLLIYQFSIAGALIYAIWMYNRNQKIAKKLAEDYHHKASLAEAMTGYRELYGLEHKDAEYMELFNSLKDQLNTNPSKSIDTFLNLPSPHEELSSSIKGVLDPQNLNVIAEKVTELMKAKPKVM